MERQRRMQMTWTMTTTMLVAVAVVAVRLTMATTSDWHCRRLVTRVQRWPNQTVEVANCLCLLQQVHRSFDVASFEERMKTRIDRLFISQKIFTQKSSRDAERANASPI